MRRWTETHVTRVKQAACMKHKFAGTLMANVKKVSRFHHSADQPLTQRDA
ncbi:hypothetical protein OK016_04975 [Vibrio chagasii]|nr:hypothetical protein [Vibrio chagasii]